MSYDVAVARCDDYSPENCRRALDEALAAVGGLDFVFNGCKIIIKANLVSALKPEKAATTHPALLCALCDILYEKGASVIIGDSPGGLYTSAYLSRVYNVTGVAECEKHHASLNRDFTASEASFPNAKTAHDFKYTSYLKDADYIIDFCKLKTHGMVGMSAGVKNMFGAVPGTVKPEYHYKYSDPDDFISMVIDINEYFRPVLTLCDAVECMEGNGPTAGTPRHMGCLIASKSQYELDYICAKLINIDPFSIKTVEISRQRGLLPPNADDISVYGDINEFAIRDFDTSKVTKNSIFNSENMNFGGRIKGKVVKLFIASKPRVTKKECIGCKKCFEICPAKAITMVGNKPKIDRGKCIKCFCCQEFCPVGAMKVKRTFIARMLQK